jgi:glycosyltransferase involved in cell wall biosynthesis
MRILISIIRFEPGRTLGSEVYLSSLLDGLSKVMNKEEIAIVGSEESCGWGELFNNKINWIPAKIPRSAVGRMIFEYNNVEKIANNWKANVVFFPFNIMPSMKIPSTLLIHDLVNEFYCKHFPRFRPAYFRFLRRLVRNSIKKPQSIITISKAIAEELNQLNLLNVEQQVHVVSLAANRRINKEQRPEHLPQGNFKIILQSGAQLPHKDHLTGINAFVELKRNYPNIYRDTKLILTGDINSDKQLKEIVRKQELESNVIFLGRLSPEELEWTMQNASIACFPTLYEGFGLGIVDAQLRKIPVIASDIPVLKEVSSGGAIFFESRNAKDLAMKIVDALVGKNDGIVKLTEIGTANVDKYSWEVHCQKVLSILKFTAGF